MFLMMLLTVTLTIYITYAVYNDEKRPIIIATGSLNQMSSFYVVITLIMMVFLGKTITKKLLGQFSISTAILDKYTHLNLL